ncbi:MAG TPA: EAL domain-containing protein [Burkholderiales bacterium]|nr:EAL domain-containing protein [Burkholderiales bacterium]
MRNALANDEFALFCQPILAFSGINRYPMGELLVRLREEEKALLPPGEFFPVFEHYRMMPQLDRWVVRSAIASLARGTGIPCLTINLSGQTLEDLEFPRFVASHLLSNKVPSRCLLFEIDESDTLIRFDAARRFSDAYREIGGGILIDGFGRKSVSFGAIQGLGPRFVKVDGSITRQLLASERAKRKMAALLTISQALNFSLIAEFVEEQDTLIRLKALGVGYAQGFGVYRPGPIESLKFSASRG